MPTINKRLEMIEQIVAKHLEESGEIRSDLKWLKRSFWALFGAGLTFGTIMVGYAFNHIINR